MAKTKAKRKASGNPLLDAMRALPDGRQVDCWFDKLTPAQQKLALLYRKEWAAGALQGRSIEGMRATVSEVFKVGVGLKTFTMWLRGDRD